MRVTLVSRRLWVVFAILSAGMLSGCATQRPADTEASRQAPPATDVVTPSPSVAGAEGTRGRCKSSSEPALPVDAEGLSLESVVIKMEVGTIRFRFYALDAPCTVARIRTLVRMGFYNGLTFHRVVPGFVIQGGDPKGDGTGGSGILLKAELNQHPHVKGTVAMARTQELDSADSQFYIALGTLPHLDGAYTVFGQVVEGLDVADRVRPGEVMQAVTLVTDDAGGQK